MEKLSVVLCFVLLLPLTVAQATASCGEPPSFTAILDPSLVPSAPEIDDNTTLADMEVFNAKLTAFLVGTVERYNQQVAAYGQSLKDLDDDAREKLTDKQCTDNEYLSLRSKIRTESRKVGGEYLIPYHSTIGVYQTWVNWYQRECRRIMNKI